MRGAALGVLLLGLAWPASAWAGWDVLDVPGQPKDVEVSPGGVYAVATSNGAYSFIQDAGTGSGLVGSLVHTAFVDSRGCMGMFSASVLQWADAGCSPGLESFPTTVLFYRRTTAGSAYVAGGTSSTFYKYSPSGGSAGTAWADVTGGLAGSAPLTASALRVGTVDVGLWSLSLFNPVGVVVDAGVPNNSFSCPGCRWTDLQLIDGDTAVGAYSDGGLSLFTGLSTGTLSAIALTSPTADPAHTVSFDSQTGPSGEGFGTAIAGDGGGFVQVFSAIPDPAHPALYWQKGTTLSAPAGAVPIRMKCLGGTFCAAVLTATDAGNLLIYNNDFPPVFDGGFSYTLAPDGSVPVTVAVSDQDSDAVFVAWAPAPGGSPDGGFPIAIIPDAGVFDGTAVTLQALPAAQQLCTDTAYNYVISATDGVHRTNQTATITIPNSVQPFDAGTFAVSAAYAQDAGVAELMGTWAMQNLNCLPVRGLQGSLLVSQDDGGFVRESVSFPGAFAIPVSPACQGSTFLLEASVHDDAGNADTQSYTLTSPALQPGLSGLTPAEAKAVCGAPLQLNLQAIPAPLTCAQQLVTWAQTGGPSLSLSPSGMTATAQTTSSDFSSLVGQTLQLTLTAAVNGATATPQTFTIPITVDPFVTVTHDPTAALGDARAPFTIRITLSNGTACPISDLSLLESLGGMTYVPGTARSGGQPVSAQGRAGAIELSGLSLPPQGSTVVTYDATPPLVGAPTPSGQAFLNGFPVSVESGLPMTASSVGCGCDASGGGDRWLWLLVAGVALCVVARRRPRPHSG